MELKKNILLSGVLFIVIFAVSCAKQERDNIIIDQQKSIESYAATFTSGRVEKNGMVWRLVLNEGHGDINAQKGDSLYFLYAAYIFSSGKGPLIFTNILEIAKNNGFDVSNMSFDFYREVVGNGKLLQGLDKGLIGVKPGEKCYVIFTANDGFGPVQIGLIPKMSPLIYEVWVSDVKKN